MHVLIGVNFKPIGHCRVIIDKEKQMWTKLHQEPLDYLID